MHVDLYVEPSAIMRSIAESGSVATQMISGELLANLIRGADRDLGLNGTLVQHMQTVTPELQTVTEMTDAEWKQFLDGRLGHSHWDRWHARNSGNLYSIVVSHRQDRLPEFAESRKSNFQELAAGTLGVLIGALAIWHGTVVPSMWLLVVGLVFAGIGAMLVVAGVVKLLARMVMRVKQSRAVPSGVHR
jgi:hypothetical protein